MKHFIQELKDGKGLRRTNNLFFALDEIYSNEELRIIIKELLLALSFEDAEIEQRVTEETAEELKERFFYLFE